MTKRQRKKLEKELKKGYLARREIDRKLAKEWGGTLGDGIEDSVP